MSQMSNKNKTKMNLKHNNKGLLAKKARSQEGSSLAIGIDLGTTYTCAGVWQQGRVNIIANEHFNRTTPSCVAFTKVGHLVGDAAKTQIASNLANTIYDVKRLIGREYDNPTVQYDKELWPFKVIPSSSDVRSLRKPWIVVEHQAEMKCFTAEEISSIILMKMKASAEAYLGSTVKDAVVTVPTYFDDLQRKATKDAAAIAGLNVVSIIEEPLAAAIACGFDKKLNSSSSANMIKNVLIFDLGGGTLDVSLLSKDYNCFSVKAVSGHTHLGGRDFDNNLVSHFVDEFRKRHGKDLSKSPKSLARLTASCERAKRMLTLATKATIELDAIIEGIDFSSTITRAQFEELNADLFETCMDCVGMCLMKGFVQKSDIDSIVLVGGSTRIPKVEQMLREFFTGKHLFKGINPDEAVATGAAILSGILNDNKTTVNSLLAGVVTPSSLGIEVLGGGMSIVVPQHTKVEAIRKGNYTTSYDNQTAVGFRIYEGEDVVAKRNHYLGEFRLTNVPAAPKGEPKFDVFFNINADSILTVIAQLKDTSNKKHITFEKPIKTYSKEFDIEKVTEAAKRKAENDLRMVLIKPKSCGAVLDKMLKSIGKTIKLIMA